MGPWVPSHLPIPWVQRDTWYTLQGQRLTLIFFLQSWIEQLIWWGAVDNGEPNISNA